MQPSYSWCENLPQRGDYCEMRASPDLTPLDGQRFGRLLVIHRGPSPDRTAAYLCACDCGKTKIIRRYSLMRGDSKSCGCRQGFIKHRLGKPAGWNSWCNMRRRCTDPNHPYWALYGGRGIKVCRRWLKFENFLADMGMKPEGLTLDRIDNDDDYRPGNCRWATHRQQRMNQRRMPLHKRGL